jgi:murein hydrolase activator
MNKYLLGIVLFIITAVSALSQTKEELEAKKNQLLQEISTLQKQLDQTQKNKNLSLSQVSILKKQIADREELISTYNNQLDEISSQISQNKNQYDQLVDQITQLKTDYAKMVVYTYKHRSAYNTLLFIFSATSFNNALERLKYYKRYSAYRQAQALQILTMQYSINGQINTLNALSDNKKKLLTEQQQQAQVLSTQKKQQDQLVGKLQKQEKQIKADLAVKKSAANKLNKQIEDIIRKEIAANNVKNIPKSTITTTSSSSLVSKSKPVITLTPEAMALSNSFSEDRGKLPWPVVQGTINESFGTHPHPILKDVTTNNNGIDILTTPGATVRAVFRGTVVAVFSNPGYHNALLISHGQYYTVYADLDEIYVKKGDEVTTKQAIGKAFADPDKGTIVHLEIWNGTDKMDPEQWLTQK